MTLSHILFIELLGGLGDVLIALPALQAIAASHPQATLTVLTFAPGGDLLKHHPLIHRVIQVPVGQARPAVEQVLQGGVAGAQGVVPYDLILTDTTCDGIGELVKRSASPYQVTNLWRNPPPDQRVSDRFLQLLAQEGWITPEALRTQSQPRLFLTATERATAQAQLASWPHPRIGLYLEAGMPIKRWAIEHFITLGQRLQQQYNARLVIPVGADPALVETVVTALPNAQAWSRGSLRGLAALFTQLDAIVAADTGPARIAAALGIPTVTLFGPSWSDRYGHPLPHRNLQGHPTCPDRQIANFTTQPCWYSGHCPLEWATCVDQITPAAVLEALAPVLPPIEGGTKPAHPPPIEGSGETERDPYASIAQPFTVNGAASWGRPQNILAIRLDNLGDVIMTSPALRALKEDASTRLTLLASPAGARAAPLLPWVDAVIPWRSLWQDLGQLAFDPEREWSLIEQLRAHQFEAAVIFTSFRQSPHPAALVCQLAGIPLRLGTSKEQDAFLTHYPAPLPDTAHQVDRNLHLLEFVGYAITDRALHLQVPPADRIPSVPYLLLNPWASCPSRTYDRQRFAQAAAQLSDQTGYPVVVTGLEKDRDRAHSLLEILGDRAIDRIGQTQFSDLVALVAHARLLLSNNTSTLHIADATQTPSVIMFAGTELEQQWQPRRTRAILLRRPTDCSPCHQFTCPYDLDCLDIAPEAIVQAGLTLLQEQD